jgi:hypothetical protein
MEARRLRAQWLEASERILAGEPSTVFLVDVRDPANLARAFAWVLYAADDGVAVQNVYLSAPHLCAPDTKSLYHAHPRRAIRPAGRENRGRKVSEWFTSKTAIEHFATELTRSG